MYAVIISLAVTLPIVSVGDWLILATVAEPDPAGTAADWCVLSEPEPIPEPAPEPEATPAPPGPVEPPVPPQRTQSRLAPAAVVEPLSEPIYIESPCAGGVCPTPSSRVIIRRWRR